MAVRRARTGPREVVAGILVLLQVLLLGCRTSTYSGVGDVVAVDDPPRHVTISHDDIPGLMPAMTMEFPVRSPAVLAGVSPGTRVRFAVEREGDAVIVTQIVPIGLGSGGRPGVHDHTPHHGGVVAMTGLVHLEAVASPDGRLRFYLSDVWRVPQPVTGMTGTVTLDLPDGPHTLPLRAADEALEADGPPIPGREVRAHVQVTRDGPPLEVHFLLPLQADTIGQVLLQTGPCAPLPGAGTGGRQPRCALSFPQPVTAVAAVPGGTRVLVAVVNAWVAAWHLPDAEPAGGFAPPPPIQVNPDHPPHGEAATAIAVSPDGRQALITIERRLLRYAVGSGRLLRQLPPTSGMVRAVAWSPDGERILVSAYGDATAHLLAAEDGSEVRRIPVADEAAAVAISPDGRWAAVGSEAGPITVTSLSTDEPPRMLVGCTRPTEALGFAGTRLVSVATDGVLRIWDAERGVQVATSEVGSRLARLAVAPDGRLVASTGIDRTIRLHDVESGAVVESLTWHGGGVAGLTWAGTTLVSGDSEGRLALWDLGDRFPTAP